MYLCSGGVGLVGKSGATSGHREESHLSPDELIRMYCPRKLCREADAERSSETELVVWPTPKQQETVVG